MLIGRKTQLYREYLGFSTDDVAAALGISTGAVNMIESGQVKPTLEETSKLSQLFRIHESNLTNGEDFLPAADENASCDIGIDLTPNDFAELTKFQTYLKQSKGTSSR